MKLDSTTFRLTETGRIGQVLLGVGIAGLVLSLVGFFVDKPQFFPSFLTAWVFWMTIGFGALFYTMVHHLVGATWSVVLRRVFESLMVVLPLMFLFFLLIVLTGGIDTLYTWSHEALQHSDHLLHKKHAWLNVTGFIVRSGIYFAILLVLTRLLYGLSRKQDAGHQQALTDRMKLISGPGMVAFALTMTFSAFDWIMSMDYTWYSTIFGVYVFAGSVIAMFSSVILISLFLRSQGVLRDMITTEHYHDLGKLLFAFTIFWAYIAFSQFFLIWYGNIPEETAFYVKRFEGTWAKVGLVVLFGHFLFPFLCLISRIPKRNPRSLALAALWMLAMHYVDLYYLIMPNFSPAGIAPSWQDATAFVGVGGIFLWLFWRQFVSAPVIPVNDPQLQTSVEFTNA